MERRIGKYAKTLSLPLRIETIEQFILTQVLKYLSILIIGCTFIELIVCILMR
jgi:hypothetical protein